MKPMNALTAMMAIGLLSIGCGRNEQPGVLTPEDTARPSASADAGAPGYDTQHRWLSGELKEVDLDAKAFTLVATDGTEHAFTFSDHTEVVGATSVQGLAGQDGAQVAVHYREEASARRAVKIELIR